MVRFLAHSTRMEFLCPILEHQCALCRICLISKHEGEIETKLWICINYFHLLTNVWNTKVQMYYRGSTCGEVLHVVIMTCENERPCSNNRSNCEGKILLQLQIIPSGKFSWGNHVSYAITTETRKHWSATWKKMNKTDIVREELNRDEYDHIQQYQFQTGRSYYTDLRTAREREKKVE